MFQSKEPIIIYSKLKWSYCKSLNLHLQSIDTALLFHQTWTINLISQTSAQQYTREMRKIVSKMNSVSNYLPTLSSYLFVFFINFVLYHVQNISSMKVRTAAEAHNGNNPCFKVKFMRKQLETLTITRQCPSQQKNSNCKDIYIDLHSVSEVILLQHQYQFCIYTKTRMRCWRTPANLDLLFTQITHKKNVSSKPY